MSFDLAKLLALGVVRFEGGEISIYGRSMVLVPAETLVEFYNILVEKAGKEEAESLMYGLGEALTTESTKRYLGRRKDLRPVFQKLTTGDPSIEMGREVFKMSGLGDIKIIEATKDSAKFVVGTKNSPIAKEYLRLHGRSSAPVCSFMLGIVGGVLKGSRGHAFSAKELRCAATGLSDECVFEFRRLS